MENQKSARTFLESEELNNVAASSSGAALNTAIKDFFSPLPGGFKLMVGGVGNIYRGDDGFGCCLAKKLSEDTALSDALCRVINCATMPEQILDVMEDGTTHILFLDAGEMGSIPGALELLTGKERYRTQLSSHRLPLGVITNIARKRGLKAAILVVQAKDLSMGSALSLSREVEMAVDKAHGLLREAIMKEGRGHA